jgi:D-alanyl-lipoteichoic acid acyltransferase DltB (MBOAT superfamily)
MPFKLRVPLLLVASYVFYMTWKPVYGVLILAMTAMSYACGLLMERFKAQRKGIFWTGIVLNLVALGFFKYAYFARDCVNQLISVVGMKQLPAISFEIVLPLGISFFAFEFIHYLADVYTGSKPVKSFLEFALFPSFFPTQIAGPIKRFQDFIPQLHSARKVSLTEFSEGVELILFGLFKKVVLADNIAPLVNRCYAHPEILTGMDLWLAIYAFTFEIYFDFSGYTDIARGSAQILGFKVPENFNLPFLASSISDFWRRWHISLSSWLRDYVFFPLGGSRKGELRTCVNLFATFVVCGLWHGAALHYVVFGALHGAMMTIHRLWQKCTAYSSILARIARSKLFHYLAVATTFHCFGLSLVIFRLDSLQTAWLVYRKIFFLEAAPAGLMSWQPTIMNTDGSIVFQIFPFLLAGFFGAQLIVSRFRGTPGIMPAPRWLPGFKAIYLTALVVVLLLLTPDMTPQFIYFQF